MRVLHIAAESRVLLYYSTPTITAAATLTAGNKPSPKDDDITFEESTPSIPTTEPSEFQQYTLPTFLTVLVLLPFLAFFKPTDL
jgi:hypothetical protein